MLPATAIVAARSLASALVDDGLFDGPAMRHAFEQWLEVGDANAGLEGFLLDNGLLAPRVLRAVLRAHGWGPNSSSDLLRGSSHDPLGLEETGDGSQDRKPPVSWGDRAGVWRATPSGWGEAARRVEKPASLQPAPPPPDLLPVASEVPTRRIPKQEQPKLRTRRKGTPKEPRVGQILGGYELVSELGRGGMGIVFAGKRDDDTRRYAVKVLRPSQSPAFRRHRERFKREIELLRQLTHKNLIRIRARGRAGDYDWYAMDHVAGTDLSRLMLEQDLSEERKLQIFEDVCRGAAHAHDHGMVHRDLKPHNVIVGENDGHAVLIDFGLAKLSESDDPRLTRTGSLLGTPYYMSPEQIRNPHEVDSQSDVWSLGVMLYELLTGQLPFPGSVPGDVCQRILHGDPIRPRRLTLSISTDLEGIILRALEKDPDRRYPSAKQLLAELVRYRRGRAVSHDGLRGRLRRWLTRNREGFLVGVVLTSGAWAAAWATLNMLP